MNNRPSESGRSPSRRLVLAAGLAIIAALPFGLASCGGGAAAIIPFITFSFEGVVRDAAGQRQRAQLNLNNTDSGKSEGTLNGSSISIRRLADGGASQNLTVNGSFSGADLRLQVPGAQLTLAERYEGSFVEDDTVRLAPSAGAAGPPITLRRVDNSFRPQLDGTAWSGQDASGRPWRITFQIPPQNGASDATSLISGTEQLDNPPQTSPIEGHVNMREIEFTAQRAGGPVTFIGRLGPAGTTPPTSPPDPARAATLEFEGGGRLARIP